MRSGLSSTIVIRYHLQYGDLLIWREDQDQVPYLRVGETLNRLGLTRCDDVHGLRALVAASGAGVNRMGRDLLIVLRVCWSILIRRMAINRTRILTTLQGIVEELGDLAKEEARVKMRWAIGSS